jgi:hypothetical protein
LSRSLVWRDAGLLRLTIRRLLTLLTALAKDRQELPLAVLLALVVDLDRILVTVGRNANNSTVPNRRADRRPSRTEWPLLAAGLKASLLG